MFDAESGTVWELRSTGFVQRTQEHALAVVTGAPLGVS